MHLKRFLLISIIAITSFSFGQGSNESIISSVSSLRKGYELFTNNDFVACIRHCDSVLNIENVSFEEKYGANELMASSHYSMGDVQGALLYKLEMLSYVNSINISSGELFYAYDHLATIYADLNKIEEAISASKKAFDAVERNNIDTSVIILASNNLGYRLLLDERNIQAIEYYETGIRYYNEFQNKRENDSIIYHILLGNLGYLEAKSGDDSGIDKLNITLKYLDYKNFNRADTRIKLADIYFLKKDYVRTEQLLNEAYSIAHDYNQLNILEDILFEKTLLYAAVGDESKLKETRVLYAKLQLQLKINNSSNEALRELSEFKLNKSESERKELQIALKVDQQQKKINSLILVLCIIIVTTIFIIVLVLYRKRKTENLRQKELHEIKGQLLETQLEKQEHELENLTEWFELQKKDMSLLLLSSKTREEKLVDIIKDLKNIKRENTSEVNTILSDIQFKLDSITTDSEKKGSSQLDNLQSSKFRNNLLKNFSELTENDLDLCMMIIAGMDTKKIGTIKGISPTSVRTNKSRLKKKMQLSKDVDLKGFLAQYID